MGSGLADPMAISYEPHRWQLEDMIAAIAGDRPPQVDGPEGLKALETFWPFTDRPSEPARAVAIASLGGCGKEHA